MRIDVLNVRSTVNKAAQVHDIIDSHNLDLLVLTETWFNGRLPPAVTDDVAPTGYAVVHSFRQNGDGGGLSITVIQKCELLPLSRSRRQFQLIDLF